MIYLIHFKNLCKGHNIPSPSTTIKRGKNNYGDGYMIVFCGQNSQNHILWKVNFTACKLYLSNTDFHKQYSLDIFPGTCAWTEIFEHSPFCQHCCSSYTPEKGPCSLLLFRRYQLSTAQGATAVSWNGAHTWVLIHCMVCSLLGKESDIKYYPHRKMEHFQMRNKSLFSTIPENGRNFLKKNLYEL
jgi:hypothetical protein